MHNFKDLEVWQKSIVLCKQIYLLGEKIPRDQNTLLLIRFNDVQFLYPQILLKVWAEEQKNHLLILYKFL